MSEDERECCQKGECAILKNMDERIEKLKDRIDGNQAILTTNRQDIEKLEQDTKDIRNQIRINIEGVEEEISSLKEERLADEHTLLHIRENTDRLEKLEQDMICMTTGSGLQDHDIEELQEQIKTLEQDLIPITTAGGLHDDSIETLEQEIASLKDVVSKIGIKTDFTSQESSQALSEISELKDFEQINANSILDLYKKWIKIEDVVRKFIRNFKNEYIVGDLEDLTEYNEEMEFYNGLLKELDGDSKWSEEDIKEALKLIAKNKLNDGDSVIPAKEFIEKYCKDGVRGEVADEIIYDDGETSEENVLGSCAGESVRTSSVMIDSTPSLKPAYMKWDGNKYIPAELPEPTDEFDAQREEYVKEMFEGKYKLVKREDLKRWKQMGEKDLGYDIAEEIEKYLEGEETK